MANYSTNNTYNGATPANLTSAYVTQVVLTGASGIIGRLQEVNFGPSGPPNATDCSIIYDLSLCTAAGTSTAATPTKNGLHGASGLVAGVNATVEPTIAATAADIKNWGMNQRATGRWVAIPGSEIVVPPTAANGCAIRVKSATYASTVAADFAWLE